MGPDPAGGGDGRQGDTHGTADDGATDPSGTGATSTGATSTRVNSTGRLVGWTGWEPGGRRRPGRHRRRWRRGAFMAQRRHGYLVEPRGSPGVPIGSAPHRCGFGNRRRLGRCQRVGPIERPHRVERQSGRGDPAGNRGAGGRRCIVPRRSHRVVRGHGCGRRSRFWRNRLRGWGPELVSHRASFPGVCGSTVTQTQSYVAEATDR